MKGLAKRFYLECYVEVGIGEQEEDIRRKLEANLSHLKGILSLNEKFRTTLKVALENPALEKEPLDLRKGGNPPRRDPLLDIRKGDFRK